MPRTCLLAFLAMTTLAAAPLHSQDLPTYGAEREFLTKHTKVVELSWSGEFENVVLVCPEYQGRVMTSTCAGQDGPSFGWINHKFIEAGKPDRHFNNYGGEDRFWLAPEGGQFSLWFKHGEEQTFDNWQTPHEMQSGPFDVVRTGKTYCEMSRRMKLTNASEMEFDLEVLRRIEIHNARGLAATFGDEVARAVAAEKLPWVGYESENTVTNRGDVIVEEDGLISIWILGMFHPGEKTVIIVPYNTGDEAKLGPVVTDRYFGKVPGDRLKITDKAVLFLGDGKHRSKIGTSQTRAKNVAGAIDFDRRVLTLVQFTMPDHPHEEFYLNNLWDLPQKSPFTGDVFNSYNDGPTEPGAESLGGFFELETLSPAKPLKTGESLSHSHRTFHFQGSPQALAKLAKAVLGVNLMDVRREMFGE